MSSKSLGHHQVNEPEKSREPLVCIVIFFKFLPLSPFCYTAYAGWAVTAVIAVKFGAAHGQSRPEVGSTKCIGASDKKGLPPAPRFVGTSKQKITPPTIFLRPKHNFFSLTVCSLEQYLQNGSENKIFLS